MKRRNLSISFTLVLLSSFATAAEAKKATPTPVVSEKKDLVSNFRCEKFSGTGLGDLKLKMIETCDLDRPFSSSLSRTVGGEDVYLFCCHKAKQ